MNSIFVTIITAAATALLTTIIKSYIDRVNYQNKLQKDLEYEQQRSVKNTVNKHKGQLIESISTLHNRLKYLARAEGYAKLKIESIIESDKTLKSTLYRFLSMFARIHLINQELIHFDQTKAHEEDLVLIKFFRIMPLVFQDKDLEINLSKEYNKRSLIQRNTFEEMYNWMIYKNSVISYTQFKDDYYTEKHLFQPLIDYLTEINPNDDTTKWDRLFSLHLLIMGFLNKFGYDFQYNTEANIKKYIKRQGRYEMFVNVKIHLIDKFKLDKDEEVKKLLRIAKYFE